jgi:hypothetical protein
MQWGKCEDQGWGVMVISSGRSRSDWRTLKSQNMYMNTASNVDAHVLAKNSMYVSLGRHVWLLPHPYGVCTNYLNIWINYLNIWIKMVTTKTNYGYFWHECFGGAATCRSGCLRPLRRRLSPSSHSQMGANTEMRQGDMREHTMWEFPTRCIPVWIDQSDPLWKLPPLSPWLSRKVEARLPTSSDGAGLLLACRCRVFRRAPGTRRRLRFARFI